MQAAGPISIAELARLLGRAADSLYYHVRQLESCGLLVTVGSNRPESGRAAGLYDVPGRPMRLVYDIGDPGNIKAVNAVVAGVLRLARRDFRRAFDSGLVVPEGPNRNTMGGRAKGWLTPAQARKARQLIEQAWELLREGERAPGAQLHAISLVMAPLAESPRATRKPDRAS